MDATIAFYIQLGISLLIFVFILYQNRILRTQLAAQQGIVSDMKAFAGIIEPEKVKEYVAMREQTFLDKTKISLKEIEAKYNEIHTDNQENQEMLFETSQFLVQILVKLFRPEDRTLIVSANMGPKSRRVVLEVLKNYTDIKPDAPEVKF